MTHSGAALACALFALAAFAGLGGAVVHAGNHDRADVVAVDMRIWQHVDDPENVWISARPAGGDWGALGTFRFGFDNSDEGGGWFWPYGQYRYGDLALAGVSLTISQSRRAPELIYASTCLYPPSCGMILLPLDDGYSRDGRYRYGDLTVAVPVVPHVSADEKALLADREQLLALRDGLAGWERTLNWDLGVPITSWTGVTVGGQPQRVTKLDLARHDLRGRLSGLLGDLTGLTELRLEGNDLRGPIPSKLLQIEQLTYLHLDGNPLEGCVPPPLRGVPNNDLDALGLPDCPPPTDIEWGEHILMDGTYRIGNILFDVPAWLRLETDGIVLNDPGPLAFILREVSSEAWIAITDDVDSYRWTHERAFDRMSESVWEAPDSVLAAWRDPDEGESPQVRGGTGHLPLQRPELTVASDGATEALILEWAGGPPAAIGWEYRRGVWEGDSVRWGDWTVIPGADGSTRSYRVDGLQRGGKYRFIVRAIETLEGLPSGWAEGATQEGPGIPTTILDQVVVGDGVTEWRLPGTDFVVTVPDGWRVVVKDWGVNLLSIQEASNDASVMVAMDTGEEQWRGYNAADEDRAAQLNALLDEILASLRGLPATE